MKITVCIFYSVCVGGFNAANIKQIFNDDGDESGREAKSLGKSFGLHSSLDGQSYMWANTSAVTTAGFFGNAAVLLTGVYLLSHSDQLVDMADGFNKLLTSNGAEKNSGTGGEVANMIEKGQEMIGDTLHKINSNMKNLREKVKKEFPKLADLNKPIKNLKDKLFPQTSKQKIPESELVSVIEQPQEFSFDNSGVFNEDFFAEHKFDFGERNEKDEKPMVLIFPDSGSDNDDNEDDGLPFLAIGDGNVVLDHDNDDYDEYDMELRIDSVDLEDEELEKLEKKKKWAENFLKNYYKLQELKLKEKEKKKSMKKKTKNTKKKKVPILKTDDMKPFVHLRQDDIVLDENTDNYGEQTEESIIDSKVVMNEPEYREIEEDAVKHVKYETDRNKGFQHDDEFRIDDEELQTMIDSQLTNFESFKIPKDEKKKKEKETELQILRKKALEVYENQMEKAIGTNIEDEEVTTVTIPEEPEGKKIVEKSIGNDDILLGRSNKRRREDAK